MSKLFFSARRAPAPLICLIPLVLPCTVFAQGAPESPEPGDVLELDAYVITAEPFAATGDLDSVRPVSVLVGAELERNRGGTLGETLSNTAGVANAGFGPGAGGVVIRGQSGPRVQVLSDGIGTQDVSALSPDHAITVEPFRAQQIEVLRGPATLLYGAGAIGGVVNVVETNIPTAPVENGFDGIAGGRIESALNGRTGFASVTTGAGPIAVHIDGLSRSNRALELGQGLEDRLENSETEHDSGVLGASWVRENGYLGVSITDSRSRYGLPGHAHEEDEDDEAHEGEEKLPFIVLKQTRYDLRGEWRQPIAGLERIRVGIVSSDYTHTEFEGPGEPGTVFDNDAVESRLEITHAPLGPVRGTLGIQGQQREFTAIGDEAFIPPVDTDSLGVFLIEEARFGPLRLEAGVRGDQLEHTSATGITRDFLASSFSLGGVYSWGEPGGAQWSVAANATRAQRGPVAEELFSNGPHLATETFETGNPDLDVETANNLDVSLRLHGSAVRLHAGVFITQFDDYIYQAFADSNSDGVADLADEEGNVDPNGELLVVNYTQSGTTFSGGELELEADLVKTSGGFWSAGLFADTVRAEFDEGPQSGQSVPRITPTRYGAETQWEGRWTGNPLTARLRATFVDDQTRTAVLETTTTGYTLLDADLELTVQSGAAGHVLLALRGRNLLDDAVREHTSFIKDIAPQAGRSVILEGHYRFGG